MTGGITGVSKGGDSMEVWWIVADGSIQAAYHDASWNQPCTPRKREGIAVMSAMGIRNLDLRTKGRP